MGFSATLRVTFFKIVQVFLQTFFLTLGLIVLVERENIPKRFLVKFNHLNDFEHLKLYMVDIESAM